MIKVTVLAMEGCSLASIGGLMEIFSSTGVMWNRIMGVPVKPEFDVRSASIDGNPVTCMNNIRIQPHCAMADADDSDLIVISALSEIPEGIKKNMGAVEWLKKGYARGAHLAGLCTGSFILAETGLLDGKTATTHWGLAKLFASRYPKIRLQSNLMITDEGDLFCSGGATGAFDLALYLIRKYCGDEIAMQSAQAMVRDAARYSQSPYAAAHFSRQHSDEVIKSTQETIEQHYANGVRLASLAETACMSRRTFERRFKAATGETPLQYLQQIRLAVARRLLETGSRSFEEITWDVGYEDPVSFRKLFQRHTGLLPSAYREKFGLSR